MAKSIAAMVTGGIGLWTLGIFLGIQLCDRLEERRMEAQAIRLKNAAG